MLLCTAAQIRPSADMMIRTSAAPGDGPCRDVYWRTAAWLRQSGTGRGHRETGESGHQGVLRRTLGANEVRYCILRAQDNPRANSAQRTADLWGNPPRTTAIEYFAVGGGGAIAEGHPLGLISDESAHVIGSMWQPK